MRKEEESRPAKRRRTEMPIADGFISNAPPKPAFKPSEPQFFSAFGESLSRKTVEPDEPSTRRPDADAFALKRPPKRNAARNRVFPGDFPFESAVAEKNNKELKPPPPPPQVASTSSRKEIPSIVQESEGASSRRSDTALKRPPRRSGEANRVLPFPLVAGDFPFESPAADPVKQNKELRPPPPPPLVVSSSSRNESRVEETPAKPKSHRLVPPPLPPVASSSRTAATTPLKQIVAPSFPNSNLKAPLKRLQPIQPPAPPKPSTSGTTDLRSISGAGFGLLNEGNAEELAGILLRDQRPEIYAPDNPAHRGLDFSPEKKGKGNAPKFLRGGLAMRASSLFNHSTTSLILWQKEVSHRSNALPPDICASVIKILHKPIPLRRGITSLPGIALCTIRAPGGASHPTYKTDHLYRIVFSFNVPSSLEHFSVGQTIRVFKPWQEISFKEDNGDDIDSNRPRLPASLPMPLSIPLLTPDPLDAPLDDTALFCSRFLIS
ncbi:hypothetical protein M413DRAFT_253182 [Hebeloma cylindrosporum]|uniref:Uncharacterized protein n=1 Tax=Hebeloma cylindrosporum TaxID=76867 RepID=A0A0C3BMM6_HEBCY|nr:hypothetical protein M413DRAFT_253182 [Hebeloma cylindrosporum h7]